MTISEQPAVICIYGASKSGKTTDALYSFPNAFYIADPGALKPALGVIGFEPQYSSAPTIPLALEQIKQLKGYFDAIVVDDFSLLTERTTAAFEGQYKGWDVYKAVRNSLLTFRDTARNAKMHVILTAHESAPTTKNGFLIRGGPRLPGRMPEDLPATCDLVLRTAMQFGKLGWQGVYRCTVTDPNYITGDRHGVTPDFSPMNIAEILRLAGYKISRAKDLDWQEELVEKLSLALAQTAANDWPQLLQLATDRIRTAKISDNNLHIRWVLRDAVDRTVLRKARSKSLDLFKVT